MIFVFFFVKLIYTYIIFSGYLKGWKNEQYNAGTCLARGFTVNETVSTFAHPAVIYGSLISKPTPFSTFASGLEDNCHNIVHDTIGNIMSTMASPNGKNLFTFYFMFSFYFLFFYLVIDMYICSSLLQC